MLVQSFLNRYRILFIGLGCLVLVALVLLYLDQHPSLSHLSSDADFQQAYDARLNGLDAQGQGEVILLLKDDAKGAKHQRFIIRLSSGQTLLVAHNIDLAPQIKGLAVGDIVTFSGVYEWNRKGGVIHWTHHDPRGRRQGGWLRHRQQIYQ